MNRVETISAECIKAHQKWLLDHGHSESTARAYSSDLRGMLAHLDQSEIPMSQFSQMVMLWLNQTRLIAEPRTINRRLSSAKAFARWAGFGYEDLNDYVAPIAAPTQPHPLAGGLPELRLMINADRNIYHRAHLALQGLCGLRVAEAIAVNVNAMDFSEMLINVIGKGAKQRMVPISDEAYTHLQPCIARATSTYQPLVRFTDNGARKFINRLGWTVLQRQVASHDLRATFATHVYTQTKDIRLVQVLLGHANIHTTETYIMINRDKLREAVDFK